MSAPKIEWSQLKQDELEEVLTAGRAEGARRAQRLMQLLGVQQQKGPGRKASDPLASLIAEFEDSDDPDTDAAADTALS